MTSSAGLTRATLLKDLRLEWRSKDATNAMLFFALLVVVIFSFSFDPTAEESRRIAGGLIWVALAASDDAGATLVRRAVAAAGGHATLIRAGAALRAAAEVFAPQDAAVAALTKRVKESFDPKGVLNPGRMWAGI